MIFPLSREQERKPDGDLSGHREEKKQWAIISPAVLSF